MSKLAKALTAAAGNAGESLYVEDVFSTYLYTGNGSTQTITNGIDLAGEGGLVWGKKRSGSEDHTLFDTEAQKRLETNTTASGGSGYIPTYFNFLGDGYFMDWSAGGMPNDNGDDYASWTFRKAEKFFDVVTYTGNRTTGHQVAHNLGVAPHVVIVKKTNSTSSWIVYFKNITASDEWLYLDETDSIKGGAGVDVWGTHTDTHFVVGDNSLNNDNGDSYVAYLFASDAGGFGDNDESIIKCGSYTGNGSTQAINLGYEPQFFIVKNASANGNWLIVDSMRGFCMASDASLSANSSSADYTTDDIADPSATGFIAKSYINTNTNTYIYIAIRRPMKTPESGTEVFATDTRGSTGDGKEPTYRSPFPVDMQFSRNRTYAGGDTQISCRLTQAQQMFTNLTNAESANAAMMFDYMNGVQTDTGTNVNQSAWMFKRATGFFDVVAYTGDGVRARQITHNLKAEPEMMIVRVRNDANDWVVYHKNIGASDILRLNSTTSIIDKIAFADTAPTESVFYVDSLAGYDTNFSAKTYVAYLFATVAGVSKVGSYTGNGSSQTIDCGFSGGARFILIKSTSTTGSWWVYDSARGIVAGNDPALQLNSTAAEVTSADAIDPDSSGFIVNQEATCSINASGVSYIFMSIA